MKDIKKIQEEIDKTKTEIVMDGYNDGWTLQWYKDKLKKLELELKKIIEDGNSSSHNA